MKDGESVLPIKALLLFMAIHININLESEEGESSNNLEQGNGSRSIASRRWPREIFRELERRLLIIKTGLMISFTQF